MQIQKNVSLKEFSTMRLGGLADYLVIVTSKEELMQAVNWAQQAKIPLFMLGSGSNVIVRDQGFRGLVIVNRILGFDVLHESDQKLQLRIGAGEVWDSIVERTVNMGLSGIEGLSLIPGTTGATPVQNVGAYGQEIADTFVELEAFDLLTLGLVKLRKEECQFSYRSSIFKPMANRRYIIVSVTLELKKGNPQPPFYESLQRYFTEHDIATNEVTPKVMREAVIAIRNSKLPDPKLIANTGSFFKNPIISQTQFGNLQSKYGDTLPHYATKDGQVKIPAGWLIEHAGLKGASDHGMKTYEKNALVLVNENAQSYADLEAFKKEIIDAVHAKFGITLEQEPELL